MLFLKIKSELFIIRLIFPVTVANMVSSSVAGAGKSATATPLPSSVAGAEIASPLSTVVSL
jgi:hypothetical protein